MKMGRLLSLGVALFMLATVSVAAAATSLADPCMSGGAYDAACDVDHNGTIDVTDIQLTAGHWGQTGSYDIYPAMVPKTGQTTSYGTGDDGDLEKGVAWPNPRFTDNGDGTVTDNLTGLIWLKNANCFSIGDWQTALNDANTLNSGECDLNDGSVEGNWRLPNVREMQSLVHYGFIEPAVPNTVGTGKWTAGNPFTGVQSSFYWTSTSYPFGPSAAWIVFLFDGGVSGYGKDGTLDVWPVRGGP